MGNHQKEIFLVLSIFLIGFQCVWAQTTQKGIVMEMSSNNKPVAGAEIKVAGASPTDSDQEGRFILNFTASLPGDPLMINDIYKKGFKIVNYEKVANWNISSASELKIVLGRTEVINALRKKYYDIGESNSEKEYRKTLAELEELKKQNALSAVEYDQKVDSMSKSMMEWQKRLEIYALKFACINRDELDAMEKQAMELLDHGDVHGAIRLYEEMKLDSAMTLKIAVRQEAKEDMKLLLPSLVNNFQLLKQADDKVACDSVAHLIYEMATDIKLKLMSVEWFFQRNDPSEVLDQYSLIVKDTQSMQEIELAENSLQQSLKEVKLKGELKKKAQLVFERIEDRKKWIEAAEETARQRLPALEQAMQEGTDQWETARQDLTDTIRYREMLTENEKQLANVRSGLELKLKNRKAALDEADTAEQRLGRELDAARQRLSVLRELEKNMDGYQNSVKAVMRAAGARRLRGIIGPVSAILKVEPGCEVAVETALGAALQNIVVENEAAAKAAIALLRSDNAGRATFLPLDTVQPGVFRGRLSGTARLASSLVQADARYDNIVSNLLGRIIVVEDINEASRVARDNGFRSRVVTMDGQVINAGGSFTGGSVQRSAGLFTRKQEMEELRIRAAKLQKDCLAAQEKTDQCKEQVDALQAELTATASEQITAANDRVRAEAEQKRLEAAAAQLETARNARRQEIDTLQAALADSRAKAEDAAKLQAELTAKIDRRTAEMSRIAEGDDSFLTRQNALAQDLSAKRLEQVTRQKDAELAYSQIAALEQRARDAAARRTSLEESVAALAARSDACRAEIADIWQTRADSQTTIAQKEAEIREATQKRLARQQAETETLARARTAADSREEMSREMARLAERKAAAESEYDQTVAKLWDEYQLSVSQAEALCVEFGSLPALRAQVADLRGKIRALGSVNVSAIEEYKEVRARYDALVTQVTDVEESRNELSRMISKLSAQMREIFTDSFRAINENFGRVFAELFGGGEASLMLEDESDVLSSGIGIRVAPPGKVIKNLEALSGGEQALVAISIYFAILAVNPAPFCILDEIEAALDDANVVRFAQYLRRVSDKTQFIVITHRRGTMEAANVLYGVTMQEDGVSKLLKLDLEQVDATLVS